VVVVEWNLAWKLLGRRLGPSFGGRVEREGPRNFERGKKGEEQRGRGGEADREMAQTGAELRTLYRSLLRTVKSFPKEAILEARNDGTMSFSQVRPPSTCLFNGQANWLN
jgi:hypothetical protein